MVFRRIRETKAMKKVEAWTKKYERFWIPLMLVGGLSGDVIQFSVLNIYEKFVIMAVYLIVSTSSLILMADPHAMEKKGLRRLRLISPFAHQFAVGGLLSTSLLFYWFSGDLSVSWPIILVVAVFMLSNEFFRELFLRPTVQVGVLSFSLFSLLSIFYSFVFNSLDPIVFVGAGLTSLVFMSVFVVVLVRVGNLHHRLTSMYLVIVSVFAFMNLGYFTNVLPPIPLAIRQAGIYHNVTHSGDNYTLTGEAESWWQKFLPGQTIHLAAADTLYAYTAIFAPTNLSTIIIHDWQFFDPVSAKWVSESALSFPIMGGREDGYRGYSKKTHLVPGDWRVLVETPRGQVLGRMRFTVVTP